MAEETTGAPPKAFLSYSWDDEDHKQWTKALATRLRSDGVDVTLDRWAAVPGDRLLSSTGFFARRIIST
jgi:hypothetical protein